MPILRASAASGFGGGVSTDGQLETVYTSHARGGNAYEKAAELKYYQKNPGAAHEYTKTFPSLNGVAQPRPLSPRIAGGLKDLHGLGTAGASQIQKGGLFVGNGSTGWGQSRLPSVTTRTQPTVGSSVSNPRPSGVAQSAQFSKIK